MGVITVLVSRAVFLTVALIIILFLTAVIIGASGYDEMILKAILSENVRAYRQSLLHAMKGNLSREEIDKLVKQYEEEMRHALGLDRPWYERILPNVYRILVLDLGNATSEDVCALAGLAWPCRVKDVIAIVLPRTIVMITVAQLICAAIAIPLGPWLAYRRGSIADRFAVSYAALFNAIPVWWLAMAFIYVFGFILGIAPTDFRGVASALNELSVNPFKAIREVLYYAYVPIITVVISFLGSWIYYTRSMVLRVVSEDFVTVARAKGLPERLVIRRHIIRAAAPPIVTYTILSLASSIGGYIITESIFDWPGMGTLYWIAIQVGDASTLLGLVYITTLVYIIARFILEVLYVILDPRVRY